MFRFCFTPAASACTEEQKENHVMERERESRVHRPALPRLPWTGVLRGVAERPGTTAGHEGTDGR